MSGADSRDLPAATVTLCDFPTTTARTSYNLCPSKTGDFTSFVAFQSTPRKYISIPIGSRVPGNTRAATSCAGAGSRLDGVILSTVSTFCPRSFKCISYFKLTRFELSL